MHSTVELRSGRRFLMGGSMLAHGDGRAFAGPGPTGRRQGVEAVTVTGYAASLQKATDAKRDSTNFTDTVFAEDIGKFPDTNIAESLNRIPGVTISREIDGRRRQRLDPRPGHQLHQGHAERRQCRRGLHRRDRRARTPTAKST